MNFFIINIVVTLFSVIIGYSIYRYYPKIQQDNVVEEQIEQLLEEQIGIDVDLSPETPDPDDK